ncbi:hypothetical protein KLP40_16610 [Hymenobacter sp. NST-14]|uniref:CARDB domain-containing protein n=1 Tax=Hymenobacter piscis TaxID=2839984 RepID=UPI001C02FACD|nr:CARDB domain-containing protein [Hymenobacter piscis]MBT9394790.1 hypothetical protein [Hymenobacter piscis]
MTHLYLLICRWPRLLALLLLAGLAAPAAAQTYRVPASGTVAYTTCSGTLYDDGGPNGSYSAGANGTVTLTPATAGRKIRLDFTAVALESGYDYISVYDGSNANAPLIGTYTGYLSPFTVYATNSTGKLTVRFSSDYSAQYSGFAATVSCVTSVPLPDLTIQAPTAQPQAITAGNSLSLSCSLQNLSGATAASSNLGYYLSTDATLSANDLLLGTSYGYSVGGNQISYQSAYLPVPAAVTAGSYYVLFVADYQNQVAESNEANNTSSVSLTVLAPYVDLAIQQAYLSTSSTTPGSSVGLSCYVTNDGNATASSSNVGYYLSADATLSANDVLLGSSYGGPLTGGYYGNYTSTYATVPATTTPGSYYVLFVADYQNQVPETNKANNVSAQALMVVTPSVDLTVNQVQLNQTTVTAGSAVTSSPYVANQGNTTAATSRLGVYFSTDATLSANDVQLTTESVGPIDGGSYYYLYLQFRVPAGATPGSYYVLFVADDQNQVSETNETNNVTSVALTVALPSVDLIVAQPYLSPNATLAGGYVYTNCSVQNQGLTTAATSDVSFYLSTDATLSAADVLLGTAAGGSLYGGYRDYRGGSFTVPAGTVPGAYYVLFVADGQNKEAETNETNNVSSAALAVLPPTIDLTVEQVRLGQNSTPAGLAITADSYLLNRGNSSAGSSSMGYYLSTDATLSATDVLLGTAPGGTLYAGGYNSFNTTLTIPATTTPGNYYVLFVADYQNQVVETDEANNVASAALLVAPPFTGTVVPYSGTATITTCNTIVYDHGGPNNYGNNANGTLVINPGTAGSKVQLGFNFLQLDGCCDQLTVYDGATTSAPLIGVYYSSPGVITATNSSGSLTLVFTSSNYSTYAGFEVVVSCVSGSSTQPDLAPFLPYTTSGTALAGSQLYVQTGIRNQGASEAGSSNLGYYLSTDNILDAADVLLGELPGWTLPANQNDIRGGQVMIPGTTAGGVYYLLHVADPRNTVAESNENNNVLATTLEITVPPLPDLRIQRPVLSHSSRTAGTVLTATCELSNGGTESAPPSVVGFYLSADTVFSSNDVLLGNFQASELDPGTQLPVTARFVLANTLTAGFYHVLFVSDYVQDIGENNESNNVAALPLTVTVIQNARDEQLAGLTLNVAPNPTVAGQSFRVLLEGPAKGQKAELHLLDALGREVDRRALHLTGPRREEVFDTRNLARGIYLLRLTGKGLNATRRVQVE